MVSSIVLAAIYGDVIVAGAALGSMGYAAAAFAINFAVSQLITRAFADNPEAQQDMGVRQQVPPSGVNAIPIVYGSAYMGGTFVDAVLANEQRKMYYVLAISSISPNGQFTFDQTSMYYGDRLIAFDPTEQGKVASLSDEVNPPDTKIAGNLFIYLFTSNQAGTITPINSSGSLPSTIMGGSDIAVDQRWPVSGRQMNGLAFAIVVLNYNRDADTTSLSPITFNVSHTLNGTGVAKPGDVWYDYITNKVYGGAVGWMPDGTFNSSFVNATSATALNTYSDELITFDDYEGNPATQARYRINGVLDAGQSVLSNIDRIMSACDSWMTYNAALGQWSVVVNKAESTSFAFDDDNIVGEIRVSATDITSSINQVEARFPFKNNRDQAAFVNIETPSGLLYPNEPVNKYSITYDLVNDSVQTHYLANRLLEQAREDLIVSFSTTYYGIQVDAGQVVSVTNSDYGWNAKLFRVMKVNEASLPNGMLGARLELSEYNAQVYDNQDITQFTPVPNSGLSSPSYFSSLAAPTVTGFPSATFPHFDVQVFVPVTGRVTWSNLYYTTSATPTASDWSWLSSANSVNSVPVANNTYYTYANNVLGAGTYYFAYNVGNDIGQSVLSTKSTAFVWAPVGGTTGPTGPTGTGGLNSATIYLYNKNTTTTPPTLFSGTFTYTFATGVLSGGTLNGWSQTPPSIAAGEYLFLSLATASSTSATDSIPYTEFSTPEVISGTGASGANTAIVSLFNKNTSAVTPPTTFSGTFTYTFATAALSGGTLNGWSQSAPTLTTGEYLWQRQATAFSTASTDTIASTEFSSAVVVGAAGTNGSTGPTGTLGPTGPTGTGTTGPTGQAGLQVARPAVYQWALSTPSISGSSTYTWATAAYTAPSGWSTTITAAPSQGFILYTATVTVTDVATATSTAFSWTSASIVVSGYAGTNGATGPTGGAGVTGPTGGNGASARIMYARIASNPVPVSGTVTVSGDNRPSGAEASAVWGASFNVTWYANDPDPSSNNSLYQADGIYNGTNTLWSTPYISALKVGALSAVSTNTGSLTISGTLQSNTAAISGTTMTGSGGVLYASGNFAFGDSTANITYNGSAININGLANASSSTFTGATDITANTSTPYSLLTFTKKNATTGLITITTSLQMGTTYVGADSFILDMYMTLRGNNGWSATPSNSRIQGVLGPTLGFTKQGGAPLTFTFMFNTNDWGSGASAATTITAGLTYAGNLYDSSGTLLTTSSSNWSLYILGANNSFYQPLLGS